jgi:mono/diheme cytochrome c family protein
MHGAAALLGWTLALAAQDRAEPEKLFAERVRPMLQARCWGCHGDGDELKSGLDLRSRAGMLRGGDSGKPAIVARAPEQSRIFVAASRLDPELQMPPKEQDRVTPDELAALRRWIGAGAPWPADDAPRARDDDWALRPLREAPPSIDSFVAARLREQGLTPAPRADRRTLIRRATFDLTGLPPTPEEVAAFVADEAPGAFERLVDRLLASPAYGEQAARRWLDVVRYADTAGFSNDFERPHAWRYRDYVVRAFNADKPFDRFVLEQIAGDELEPAAPEGLVAAGFLRMGPWEQTSMSVAAVTRQFFLDDVTHQTAAVFLGLTMRCARCHDHKFDPIPTRDYYRLQAVFAPTQFAERDAPFLAEENTAGFDAAREALARRRARPGYRPIDGAPDDAVSRKSHEKIAQKRREHFEREAQRYEPRAMSVYNGPLNAYSSNRARNPMPAKRGGPLPDVFILRGGALESPGERVEPGVPSAVAGPPAPEFPAGADGRRLALARWIVDPRHPLTPRVLVNRVWQQHFGGHGLVATPNNFGRMGRRPTHPELLDALAATFVREGWSVKKLHRLIMTSETYQRADAPVRRLEAEEIRDAMLAVSGELNREAGGPGVFPEIHWEVALQPRHVMGGPAPAYQPSPTPRERHRRTIYAFRARTLEDPMLEVFNRPGSELSCERRDETTVATQALALLNGRFAHDRALATARRLEREAASPAARVDRAFLLAYGRPADDDERAAADAHVRRMTVHHRAVAPVRRRAPLEVRREMIEEFTGEPVRWIEELDRMTEFVPDLAPADVGPETRALAELCLVIFNSNEFLYLR